MKKKLWILLGIILIGAGIVVGGIGLKEYLDEKNAGDDYKDLKEDVIVPSVSPVPKEEKDPSETKEPLDIPVDFAKLTEKCSDIYAWIRIPGTDIDYPIVQREGDNAYYLNHTIEGKKKIEGAIFTEDYNTRDFTDPHTVIYGHNMKNGSMFRQLHRYEDRKFFQENDEILIYQPEQILHYQIFAAYVYDDRHLLMSFDCENPDEYAAYLDSIFRQKNMNTMIDTSVTVTEEDKIVTLSTCNGNDDERYLVQAVLVSIEN